MPPGTHLATFVAGINVTHVTGSAVYITAGGQLGVLASSERYKTAVAKMGAGSQRLSELQPVTFRLKNDPKGQTLDFPGFSGHAVAFVLRPRSPRD